jgi:hypothetical protein
MQMNDTSKRVTMIWASMAAATFMIAQPAFSQAPTDAQRAAIKSQCRSDYIAHCSSVPPGGMASLQCLQKNMASLSSSCQTAVRAVAAPSETKAEPAAEPKETAKEAPKEETKSEPAPTAAPAKSAAEPAAAPPKAAASSTAKKPSSAQVAAIRSACRSDYPNVCAGVPTGGAPALQCLEKNKSKVSGGCQQAVAAASGGGTAAPAAGGAAPATEATASPAAAPAAAAPAAPPLVLRPMRPREVLFVMRSACGADVRALCPGVEPGGGRIIECLVSQSASLSPACQGVLGQFAAQ